MTVDFFVFGHFDQKTKNEEWSEQSQFLILFLIYNLSKLDASCVKMIQMVTRFWNWPKTKIRIAKSMKEAMFVC